MTCQKGYTRSIMKPTIRLRPILLRPVALVAMSLCFCILGHANSVTFATPTGSLAAGESVSASAVFTTGANSVSITLSNLLSAATMHDAGQLLSDLFFTLNTAATGTAGVTSSDGKFIDVSKNGSVVSASPVVQPGNLNDRIGWFFSNSGGNSWHLDGLNGGSSNNPAQLILGGTTATATYPIADGSIAGNPAHNPFVQGTGNFVLNIPGVTSTTNITGATFSFSTGSGVDVTGQLQPTPEPRFYTVLLSLGLLFGLVWRRRFAA
jgi:hypothetical protein